MIHGLAALAGGVLLGAAFFDLLPEALEGGDARTTVNRDGKDAGAWRIDPCVQAKRENIVVEEMGRRRRLPMMHSISHTSEADLR